MVDRRSLVSVGFLFSLLFQFTFEQIVPLSSNIEQAALFDLRSSLGLRSKEWPRKVDPCSLWKGITCENGRVIGINISGFRRTRLGKLNPQFSVQALANFTLLQSFNASNFLLPGSIPDWFGLQLSSLKVLDLRSCSVNGAIPPSLGNLTNLTSLYLSDNSITGIIPDSLGQLLSLSVLNFSRNRLSGTIPASFVSLGNLSSIDISTNSLSGSIPPGIGALTRLQYLNLSDNSLMASIPSQLGNLSSLVDLDLSFNYLTGGVPPELRELRSLRRMILSYNTLDGPLSENLFPTLSQLQVVVLRQNNFTGDLPAALWSLPRLSYLDLSGNNFTGMLPNSSSNQNTTAAMLNISNNMFYGSLNPNIRRFRVIDLSSNYFEGKILDFMLNVPPNTNCLQNVSNQRTAGECASFYAKRGLTFDNFGRPNSTGPPATESSRKSNRYKIILAGVLGGFGLLVILLLLLFLFLLCTRKRRNSNQRGNGVGPAPPGSSPPAPGMSINFINVGDSFTIQQLLQATGDFNDANLIKHGHSGDLFNGVLESGIPVVIKRVDARATKKDTFLVELDFFSKISHTRFVPLLGHCLENENEKFLVYKHMPNGDLSNSLYYKKSTSEDGTLQSLDWITRLKIAIGAAEALSYLHHECNPPFVHRDIQASSILLDDKYEVRLGSLSEVCTQEGDSHQSKITRLLRLPQSSDPGTSGSSTSNCAYDVYCFGKILLELVTGKMGISASSDAEFKEWLDQMLPYISIYDKELVAKIVDPSLVVDEDFLEEVWAIAIVARSCLNPKPSRRPPMRYVLKALENPFKVVREEGAGSSRLRTTSSRGSWNAALFGSWRQSSSDVTAIPAASGTKVEGGSSLKHSGTTGSQGSGHNGGGSSSRRRHSSEIFPEPSNIQDIERPEQ
ncbi:probable LRR receptor-like serine/threonine-protein kinase At2g16250 [Neltuma alba]|uniref:probable LRR receptor-like serine/threonine-protein kinase At2g16250 n=1 Tax=Neltuma alba TaxID=207710 RepID=UPI0010A4D8E5|nr:probable LRR receptor-like serine/threonine-protein kinase At2g16250 [Prosopis alba]XP_028797019.1 probable LRR receptor-like serine/threonine-protein kinase At2g16250 [Prosopis alba]